MYLYLKQKAFSWGDKFAVYDAAGNVRWYAYGDVFTWGRKLHVCDINSVERCFIRQRLMTWLPKYEIYIDGVLSTEVNRKFTFFTQEYTADSLGWYVTGDVFAHDYMVTCGSYTVASVSKEWFSWGDAYAINIADDRDEMAVLALVLAIDATMADSQH